MSLVSISVRSAQDAAEAYVLSRRKSPVLSTATAIRAIRTLLPKCQSTDRELADMVASAAIQRGLSVSFDGADRGEVRVPYSDRIPKAGVLAALAASSEGDPRIGRVVSTSKALEAFRRLTGDRTTPDEELVALLADAAIASSCSVIFDHRGGV
jgi:hypothetical protein